MNTTVGRHNLTLTLCCPVLTPPHTSSHCPFFTSPLSACPPPLPNICLLSSLYDIPLQWAGLRAFLWPFSQKEKQLCSGLYLCSYWSLSLLFQCLFWFKCRWRSSCAVPSYSGKKKKEQKKMVLWPRCRWRITKVKMMTVLKNKVSSNKVETYVSGNSTGLVLILLCKASMYSSMKGHCRKSRRKEVKTTRTHMHDACCTGRISERPKDGRDEQQQQLAAWIYYI